MESFGGDVGRTLAIIDGFAARVPSELVDNLRRVRGVQSVTPNGSVQLLGSVDGIDPNKDPGSWLRVVKNTKLHEMWQRGWTGKGIDVALIDSGVAPVEGLMMNVINGPDLSFESQASNLTNVDTYGHGTHLAGLIAGRDAAIPPTKEDEEIDRYFVGAAPGARIVNVKVAASDGATDVSQVIAAIDWVVQNRDADGLNIRVLNLSFGTDGTQDYRLDPLAYAAEVAWRKGIVVVVAAGNSGFGTSQLNNPAYDPYVIAVGADNTKGTDDPKDDVIPVWQTRGNALRHPELVAPGKSLVSLRDPRQLRRRSEPRRAGGRQPILPRQRVLAGCRSDVGRGRDAVSATPPTDPRRDQGPPDAIGGAAPERRSGRTGRRAAEPASRPGDEDRHVRGLGADVGAFHRPWVAPEGARDSYGRGRRHRPARRANDIRGCVGSRRVDRWELGRLVLVERNVERPRLVRQLLVRRELGRQDLVRTHMERELVVGAHVEWPHVVGADVERRRLVLWRMG